MSRWLVKQRWKVRDRFAAPVGDFWTVRPAEAHNWATREEAQSYINDVLCPFEPVEIDDAGIEPEVEQAIV